MHDRRTWAADHSRHKICFRRVVPPVRVRFPLDTLWGLNVLYGSLWGHMQETGAL